MNGVPLLGPSRGPLPAETDVAVIGGGIAGAAMAFYLAREGVEVVLLDRAELNREASGTNAGSFHLQLAIHQLSGKGTDTDRDRLLADARLSLEAYGLWQQLDRELDGDVELHETGGWMVAETPEQVRLLHEKHELERLAGIETEVVEGSELRERAPFFSERVLAATYCPVEGHANPLIVAPLYAARAAEHGAELRTGVAVQGIDRVERRPGSGAHRFTVRTDHGDLRAHRVVDCAGAWSGEVAQMVGLRLPVRSDGLHVNVTERRPRLLTPMVQHIGRRLTLKQSSVGSFIIGGGWPSRAVPGPRRYPTQWQSAAGNVTVAVDIVPALADARVVRTWSGVIVFTDDMNPVVGESERVPGFHVCVASTGFTFGPMFARQLAEQMTAPGKHDPFPDRYAVDRATA
ncbi:FAD-binding oxidoreductase [Nocardioides anomalus]|uniref:FAD-binding oxidoreductase n=1 Tax=Nocardioides anomalus TaxID=2712223 RepID=A0A6G6W9X1_9ACTN|nr:FAD-dependent oxidoreductase [Nocardioides anomalus]QIG42022.1 FAD-binding oxidoreductase [Nocardioides anomalus]